MIDQEITKNFLDKKREEEILGFFLIQSHHSNIKALTSDFSDEEIKEPLAEEIKIPQNLGWKNTSNSSEIEVRCGTLRLENVGVFECYQIRLTVRLLKFSYHLTF